MNEQFAGWRRVLSAAMVTLALGSFSIPAMASDDSFASSEPTIRLSAGEFDTVALELRAPDLVEKEALEMGQRYRRPPPRRPPPPRYRHYRVQRPYYRVRIVPPALFAPGWFGFYFLGVRPPPPQVAPTEPARVPRKPDFRHVGDYSLSINAGAYSGAYADGTTYDDPGLRIALSYRNAPVLGAELAVGFFGTEMRFDEYGTDVRSDIPIQMSAVLHAFPRSPIQPYFLFGATGNIRTYRAYNGVEYGQMYQEFRVGPHAGVGVEFLIADKMSISVDARSIYYTLVNRTTIDYTRQNDVTFTGGMAFYF